mmetsp:Transcript_98774/g.175873  ORF Transcript_98774/g.175873 Transcript_98774/m.175873 type:complete len:501 (-) Transcript_98774:41-1543(-)
MSWKDVGLALAVIELLFYVFLRLKSRGWKQPLDILQGDFPASSRTPEDILRMIEEHMSRSRKHAEEFLSLWHFNAPVSQLRRADAEDLLIWSAFTRRRHEISEEELRLVETCLDRVEAKLGLAWSHSSSEPPGHPASSQKFAAHTWETDCSYNHMPLVVYFMMWAFNRVVGTPCLLLLGFRYRRQGFLGYWVREQDCGCARRARKAENENFEGLVFFHGICPGLVTYLQFLMRFRHQKVVLIELHWVTFNPFNTTVPSQDEFCNAVVDLLDANGVINACLSAHSYGSFMVAWLLRFPRFKDRILRVVIVSGPALSLFTGTTCKTVCYDKPIWFDYCLAHIFFRQFFWHQCVLTAADLPPSSTVVLVEHDELIPVNHVVKDCEDHGVRCHIVPRTQHGFEMVFPVACSRMVQFIRQGHGEPLKNDKGVGLFFHAARSSKLYSRFYDYLLRVLDAVADYIVMYGHSPFNLQVLSYVDELWPGGRRSPSAEDMQSLLKEAKKK